METFLSFIEAYKDLINIVIGVISGIFLSTVTFLLNYRNSWRNKLTKELTVKLRFDLKRTSGKSLTEISFRYDINNSNGNPLIINYAYLELPKKIKGNVGPNQTLGEMLFETGRYYLFNEPKEMTHNLSGEIKLSNAVILKELTNKRVKKLRMIVLTSRYGKVKSNYVRF